ncbi:uncharacterized protein LOC133150131 isoform X2 [Syngnathus typhle]|uniref:uncharacterized protein LOC133150131 isoform X2 n=1 Tax=Syngnathus typhle TaxID=161592 RepID=UPI002A6A850E|nr:uncharacterized protein LOC133150131 isoform X2 [Syngnathus typhle]
MCKLRFHFLSAWLQANTFEELTLSNGTKENPPCVRCWIRLYFLCPSLRSVVLMLPGYGFSPFPDFHHPALRCSDDGPTMWLPGKSTAALISDPHDDDESLPHRKHVAVCQQETLTFIDLQPSVKAQLNGCGGSPGSTYAQHLDSFRHSGELIDWAKSYLGKVDEQLSSNSFPTKIKWQNSHKTCLLEHSDGAASGCHPHHIPLSLPLAFPLSPLYTNRDSWDSQIPCSPSPPEGPDFPNLDSYQAQRRTSQGRKMQVYSPDSLSDDSLSSPVLDADFLFPVTFTSFLEEDLCGQSSQDTDPSPSSTEATPDLRDLSPDDILQDSLAGVREDSQDTAMAGSSVPRSRQADHERRRFSASELISRLQLSQKKNSFTLKLGKSLSARVASKDRQSLSPDYKSNAKPRGSYNDSAPHSPVGPVPPPLPSSEIGMPTHWWSSKLGMRKRSTEEDLCTPPVVSCSNRLSRFLPSSILYQEYSDVAINREIQRQQGKEPGTDEDGLKLCVMQMILLMTVLYGIKV